MSKLRSPNGDDYPDAATKHLNDARVLLDQGRLDGAAYLSGYAAECALKSLYYLEARNQKKTHVLSDLVGVLNQLLSNASSTSARYFGTATRNVNQAKVFSWKPSMRYQSEFMTHVDAKSWYDEAHEIYSETIFKMKIDGVA